jgi:Electron transfer DM13
MKKTLLFILLISVGIACQKNEELQPVAPISNTGNITPGINKPVSAFDSVGQKLIARGMFMSNVHPTSGGVKLYQKGDKYSLVFNNFKTDSGPDLRIYLSEDRVASRFVEIGKGVNLGDFFIELPSAPDLKTQKYILIWCKPFSVLFGNAELKQ